jgi:predicted DNA-binding transcriptional regulator YafY
MYHPTTRLLTILELLQARGTLGGAELAVRLEVDRRTVRKYIMMLQDLGIPIESVRGPAGGYHLRPGFKLPPLMLTNDEALAVVLSLMIARRQGIPAEPHWLEGALAKIERVLPESLRSRVQAVQSAVSFVAPAVAPQPSSEHLLMLSSAVRDHQRVELQYRSQEGETIRLVDPYGIVSHWDQWYMIGWCHLRQAIRIFRLDRISAVELGETIFTAPKDFDSLAYLLESLAMVPRGSLVEVLLELPMSEVQRQIPPGSAIFEERTNGVIIRFYSDDLNVTARYLLLLGCPFVIHRPTELQEAMQALVNQAAQSLQRSLAGKLHPAL